MSFLTKPMNCSKCGKELGEPVACMSGSINGDETTDCFHFCPDCNVYTVGTYWDFFDGEEKSDVSGPVEKAKGDADVALIKQCKTPWDKKCRCEAHMKYFDGNLD